MHADPSAPIHRLCMACMHNAGLQQCPHCPPARSALTAPPAHRHVEIVPLSTGCLGACTYCKTKHARGHLGSYDPDALVERVRQAAMDPEVGA